MRLSLRAVVVAIAAMMVAIPTHAAGEGHGGLVITEVVTGGSSASDEFVELFNAGPSEVSLAGVEVVYVSAGGTEGVRAAWSPGAVLPASAFVVMANAAGAYAAESDVVYGGGLAAAGGTLVLRRAGELIDAVAWGAAAPGTGEGAPAPAPPAGAALHRAVAELMPIDSNDNATDFSVGPPSPRALGGPAASSLPSPSPSTTAVAAGTPTSTPMPSATSVAAPLVSITTARGLADGTIVTVEGLALTDSAFHDGGGYLADATAGIAVLVDGDVVFDRGEWLRMTGTLDQRFSQRTLRVASVGVARIAPAISAPAVRVASGAIGEAHEGRLVQVRAAIRAGPSVLSAGEAFDLDDGSGVTRVVVAAHTGIDTAAWRSGSVVELVGVVGQRDSSGTGSTGYRLQPRGRDDVVSVTAASPSPQASRAPGAPVSPTSTAAPSSEPIAIAAARAAPTGTEVAVRGVVTLHSGLIDETTAIIEDGTAAIVLRLDDGHGALGLGAAIEARGTRSSLAGMATIRLSVPPSQLGMAAEPAPLPVRALEVGEELEARLVWASGRLVASARRSSSGAVTFEIDDGTGTLRVSVQAGLALDDGPLEAGTLVDVVGVVGQETTSAEPNAGYRLWPRATTEIRVLGTAEPPGHGAVDELQVPLPAAGGADLGAGSLDQLDSMALADLRIGATLVAREWPELGLGGLLWDGSRLVGVSPDSSPVVASLGVGGVPVPLELTRLSVAGAEGSTGIPLVSLSAEPGAVAIGGVAAEPSARLPDDGSPAAWVRLVGRAVIGGKGLVLLDTGGEHVRLEPACDAGLGWKGGDHVSVTGIGLATPRRMLVPCDGVRPAPLLAATLSDLPAPPTGHGAVRGDGGAAPRSAAGAQLAALLLLVGGALLGAASFAWWRLAAEIGVDDKVEADPAGVPVGEEGPELPRLTLVPLRRDRPG